jgi:hypothetical protein
MRFIAVRDIGWFAAHMLANSQVLWNRKGPKLEMFLIRFLSCLQQYEGKNLEIASQVLSYDEAAAAFARFTGRNFIHRRAAASELPQRPGGNKPAAGSSKNLVFSADPEKLKKVHPGIMTVDDWIKTDWNGRQMFLDKAKM